MWASEILNRVIDQVANALQVKVVGEATVSLSGSVASEYEAITVDNTVGGKGCTAAKYAGCNKAFMTLEGAQIRFTIDGTAPTTTIGHLLEVGDILKLDSNADIVAFRAIRTGATSGSLRCTYSA